jgi:NAD(P)-dependent dehydrogenase (short-subunit alcohol dehydrogenase family)
MAKTILVTGSSRGLGFAIAKELSFAGFNVVLIARDEKLLQKAMSELNPNLKHNYLCYDLTKKDVVKVLDKFLQEKNIRVDGIVHNLGGKVKGDSQPLHVEVLRESMRLNLEVSIEINNYFVPKMIEQGGGKIVHISSSSAKSGNASSAYAISKGALNTYIKNFARYYAKNGICMCGIVPSIIEHEGSEWSKKAINEPQKYKSRKESMPLKRFATPKEIAPYVKAIFEIDSMQITGSIIDLEGGV